MARRAGAMSVEGWRSADAGLPGLRLAYIGDMSAMPPDETSGEAGAELDAEAEAEARLDAEAEAAAELEPEAEGEE